MQSKTNNIGFYVYDDFRHSAKGSSSFITNALGYAEQHLQYLPFGESFIDQRNSTWETPYIFSAKEKDLETGYSYFGARYYSPEISVWLSVDPLADMYPSISSVNYCGNRPVMLMDPNGESTNPIFDESGELLGTDSEGWGGTAIVMKKDDFKPGMDHSEAEQKGTYLNDYGKGINISDESWDKVEENGGEKMIPYVENNSNKTIYYKPEEDNGEYKNDEAYPIAPNTDLYAPIDGVATHEYSNAIYKVCTGTHISINKDGEVDQTGWALKKGGYISTMPMLDGWIMYGGRLYKNGKALIPNDALDDGIWEFLFKKAVFTGGTKY